MFGKRYRELKRENQLLQAQLNELWRYAERISSRWDDQLRSVRQSQITRIKRGYDDVQPVDNSELLSAIAAALNVTYDTGIQPHIVVPVNNKEVEDRRATTKPQKRGG